MAFSQQHRRGQMARMGFSGDYQIFLLRLTRKKAGMEVGVHEKGKGSIAEICRGGGKIFDLVETQQEDQSSFLFCLSFLPSPDLRCRRRVCFLLGISSRVPLCFSIHHGLAWHAHGRVAGGEWGAGRGERKISHHRVFCECTAALCVLFEEMIRVYFIARKGCQPLWWQNCWVY